MGSQKERGMAEQTTNGAPKGASTKRRKAAKGRTKRKDSKTAFIRAQPRSMAAKKVVAKAKEAGMKLTVPYVYSVRSKMGGNAPSKGAEAEFRRALQGITLARAQEIVEEIEAAYKGK
jgi:hypothetical protein